MPPRPRAARGPPARARERPLRRRQLQRRGQRVRGGAESAARGHGAPVTPMELTLRLNRAACCISALSEHKVTAITVPLPLLSDSPEAGRHWLPVRCSLARSLLPHIRHRSLNIQDVPLPAGRRGGAVAVRRLLRELPPVAVRRLLQYIRVRELPEEWSVRRLLRELPEERSSGRSNCSPPSTVRELPGERSQFAGFYASCRRSGRSSPSTVCELPEERSQFAF